MKNQREIEDSDRRIIELERSVESLEIKKQSVERQFELFKKQAAEQNSSLNEIVNSEKATRDMWIERFEKEQAAHNQTQQALLQVKSDLKD